MFGSKKVVGLDIGTSHIKIAELDVSGKSATLQAFAMAPTPSGAINSGEISNPSSISTAIQALKAEIRTKRKFANTGLWGTAVIVKKVQIPKMDKKMVAEQIKFEAEQYIPFDLNTIHLDYYILPKSLIPDTMDLILVAAQTEIVLQYVNTIRGAGLEIGALDVSAFALGNAFELGYGKLKGETIGVLNIGAGVTNLVVLSDGYVVYARDFSVGGITYSTEIQKEMGVTFNEAESLKLGASTRSDAPEQVHATIRQTNETIANEIHDGIEFISSSNAGMTISRLFVTGGSSVVPGLIEAIGKSTKCNVEIFSPFNRIKIGNKALTQGYLSQVAPFAAVALGLGIRQVGDK